MNIPESVRNRVRRDAMSSYPQVLEAARANGRRRGLTGAEVEAFAIGVADLWFLSATTSENQVAFTARLRGYWDDAEPRCAEILQFKPSEARTVTHSPNLTAAQRRIEKAIRLAFPKGFPFDAPIKQQLEAVDQALMALAIGEGLPAPKSPVSRRAWERYRAKMRQ